MTRKTAQFVVSIQCVTSFTQGTRNRRAKFCSRDHGMPLQTILQHAVTVTVELVPMGYVSWSTSKRFLDDWKTSPWGIKFIIFGNCKCGSPTNWMDSGLWKCHNCSCGKKPWLSRNVAREMGFSQPRVLKYFVTNSRMHAKSTSASRQSSSTDAFCGCLRQEHQLAGDKILSYKVTGEQEVRFTRVGVVHAQNSRLCVQGNLHPVKRLEYQINEASSPSFPRSSQ